MSQDLSKPLMPFQEGDSERTAFSAGTMNEIEDRINMLLKGKGIYPLRIVWADSGWTISIDKAFLNKTPTQPTTAPEDDDNTGDTYAVARLV